MSNYNNNPYGYNPYNYGGIANNGQFYPVFPQQPQPSMQLFAVNGVEGAKGYTMLPNSTVYLMDCDNPIFYIKKADEQGKCTIQAFALNEISLDTINKPNADTANFATKADIASLEAKLQELTSKLDGGGNNAKPIL